MCRAVGVSSSGYYSWLRRTPSRREQQGNKLLKRIKQVHDDSRQRYGSPRITAQLRREGFETCRPRVARIMRAHGIRARRRRSRMRTTHSNHSFPVAPNILERRFSADRLNQVWASDITYIRTLEGWLYLTTIMDLADRQILGWSMSTGMSAKETSIPAWQKAVARRPVEAPLLFHSDQGVQFACKAFVDQLQTTGLVRQSMARRGDCWDNAVIESFYKTLKYELAYEHVFPSRRKARLAIFEYIETWYNRWRLHSSLGYCSPIEAEQKLLSQQLVAA